MPYVNLQHQAPFSVSKATQIESFVPPLESSRAEERDHELTYNLAVTDTMAKTHRGFPLLGWSHSVDRSFPD